MFMSQTSGHKMLNNVCTIEYNCKGDALAWWYDCFKCYIDYTFEKRECYYNC